MGLELMISSLRTRGYFNRGSVGRTREVTGLCDNNSCRNLSNTCVPPDLTVCTHTAVHTELYTAHWTVVETSSLTLEAYVESRDQKPTQSLPAYEFSFLIHSLHDSGGRGRGPTNPL
jgi:hypothetical protein